MNKFTIFVQNRGPPLKSTLLDYGPELMELRHQENHLGSKFPLKALLIEMAKNERTQILGVFNGWIIRICGKCA